MSVMGAVVFYCPIYIILLVVIKKKTEKVNGFASDFAVIFDGI